MAVDKDMEVQDAFDVRDIGKLRRLSAVDTREAYTKPLKAPRCGACGVVWRIVRRPVCCAHGYPWLALQRDSPQPQHTQARPRQQQRGVTRAPLAAALKIPPPPHPVRCCCFSLPPPLQPGQCLHQLAALVRKLGHPRAG
jgi:hypothetical protein